MRHYFIWKTILSSHGKWVGPVRWGEISPWARWNLREDENFPYERKFCQAGPVNKGRMLYLMRSDSLKCTSTFQCYPRKVKWISPHMKLIRYLSHSGKLSLLAGLARLMWTGPSWFLVFPFPFCLLCLATQLWGSTLLLVIFLTDFPRIPSTLFIISGKWG